MTEKGCNPVARTVLQQCLQARLQVKPADEHSEAQFVQVRHICHCFADINQSALEC